MNQIDPTRAQSGSTRAAARLAWRASMVRPLADRGVGEPASFLRKSFTLEALSGSELLHISAQGLYRAFINGQRVGNDLLTPGWTCYGERLSYQSYAVGDLLRVGENTIDIWLADGWYRSQMMWARNPIFNTWGDKIAAIAELRSGPGEAETLLATDASWGSGALPIVKSGIYFGEVYDARREHLEVTEGSEAVPFDTAVLIPHETAPVHEFEPLHPVQAWTDEAGRTVYDFGQNSAGYVAITVRGKAGAEVRVEHAEIVVQGVFDNSNYRSAEARIVYILKGEGEESYRPCFTFQGFRYARVSIEGEADLLSIVSVPISSVGAPTASFKSGHPLVNRLVENTIWSQRGNFIEVPTDCPQRDERLGWTGDAQVFAATACYLHDSQSFLRKWLRDVMADQRPDGAIPHVSPDPTRGHEDLLPGFYGSTGWGDAICIVPWVLYTHYGDREILEETLPAMVRWNDFVWSISDGPIVRPPRAWSARGFTFGDWLQPGGANWPLEKSRPMTGDDAAATIYLYISSALIARIATLLGAGDIAARMGERAESVRRAFAEEFVTPSGRLVYDDQTTYALAILHDLVPEDRRAATASYFKAAVKRDDYRIGTGFIGTPALLPALVKIGEPEMAGRVFLQEEVPGWLYQVKTGATTIWERWDSIRADGSVFDPEMNSYNHYAYGAVCQWLFESAAGFRPDPDAPGFAHVLFEPTIIAGLGSVEAGYQSIAGPVAARWSIDGDRVTYEIEVPAPSTATLVLAAAYRDVGVDGEPRAAERQGESLRVPLGPGHHVATFRVTTA